MAKKFSKKSAAPKSYDPAFDAILDSMLASKTVAVAPVENLTVSSLGGEEDYLQVHDDRTDIKVFEGTYAQVSAYMGW